MFLSSTAARRVATSLMAGVTFLVTLLLSGIAAAQDAPKHHGGEASLVLPDLESVQMLGMSGKNLLMLGLAGERARDGVRVGDA